MLFDLMRTNLIIFLFILQLIFHGCTTANAQSPSLLCVSVNINGNVQLSWAAPSDTCGSFTSYDIYYATQTTYPTFIKIDSISNFSQLTYTHTGANADIEPVYYYIQNNSGCFSNISDTLQSIFLTVINQSGGTADLSWNALHTPGMPTSTGWYIIYREDSNTGSLVDRRAHV